MSAWRGDGRHDPAPFPSGHNPVEIVLSAIEQTTGKPRRRSGNSWRLCCPNCGGSGYKVSIAEGDDGCALVTCFSCHDTPALLDAVGLRLGDLYMPRNWPASPEERRRARKAIREAGQSAALSVLALESKIVLFAARELWALGSLTAVDGQRLREAVDRIGQAANVMVEGDAWRPNR